MDIKEILLDAVSQKASDIFIIAGMPLTYKVNNQITRVNKENLVPHITRSLIEEIYEFADRRDINSFLETGDDDFSFSYPGLSRFRVSTYKQRGSLAAVIRVITFSLPDPQLIGIPEEIVSLGDVNRGLVLVTGPAGCGKSTTLACMIDHINQTSNKHIITLEDPIEYLHPHKNSIVSQREINLDTQTYIKALRACLRQSPDVILLGEMRDYETINVAITAAETGHLIISTLHTIGSATTIDRIIDVFPPEQQHQVAIQLSHTLQAVVSQQLVPSVDGSLIPAFEIMKITPAIRNMIRENKIHQIDNVIATSAQNNMISMDGYLIRLYKEGKITRKTAIAHATNPDLVSKKI